MSGADNLLQIAQLRGGYSEVDIIHGIDLAVAPGEIVTIAGTNGAGKSTLVKALLGLLPRVAGTIHLGGRDITALSAEDRFDAGLGVEISQPGLGHLGIGQIGLVQQLETGTLAKDAQFVNHRIAGCLRQAGVQHFDDDIGHGQRFARFFAGLGHVTGEPLNGHAFFLFKGRRPHQPPVTGGKKAISSPSRMGDSAFAMS